MREYYELLGIEPGATEAEIKKAFRRKMSGLHQDKGADPNNPDADALKKAQAIGEAYNFFKKNDYRTSAASYNTAGGSTRSNGTSAGNRSWSDTYRDFNFEDLFKSASFSTATELDLKTPAELDAYAEEGNKSNSAFGDQRPSYARDVAAAIKANPALLDKTSAASVMTLANTTGEQSLAEVIKNHGTGIITDEHFKQGRISGDVLKASAKFITGETLKTYADQGNESSAAFGNQKPSYARDVAAAIKANTKLLDGTSASSVIELANATGEQSLADVIKSHGAGIITDEHFKQMRISGTILKASAKFITGETLKTYADQGNESSAAFGNQKPSYARDVAATIKANPALLDKTSAASVVKLASAAGEQSLTDVIKSHGAGIVDDTHFRGVSISGDVLKASAKFITGETLKAYAEEGNKSSAAFGDQKPSYARNVAAAIKANPALLDETSVASVRELAKKAGVSELANILKNTPVSKVATAVSDGQQGAIPQITDSDTPVDKIVSDIGADSTVPEHSGITEAAPVNVRAVASSSVVKPEVQATSVQPPEIILKTIPYDTLSMNGNQKVYSSGKSSIISFADRKMVVVDIDGFNMPFYLSSGNGGKKDVPAGKWYPFLGIGTDGWINKPSSAEIVSYYGNEQLRKIAEHLDRTIGDIRNSTDIPRTKATGAHIDFINQNMIPSENETSKVTKMLNDNIQRVADHINSSSFAASAYDSIPNSAANNTETTIFKDTAHQSIKDKPVSTADISSSVSAPDTEGSASTVPDVNNPVLDGIPVDIAPDGQSTAPQIAEVDTNNNTAVVSNNDTAPVTQDVSSAPVAQTVDAPTESPVVHQPENAQAVSSAPVTDVDAGNGANNDAAPPAQTDTAPQQHQTGFDVPEAETVHAVLANTVARTATSGGLGAAGTALSAFGFYDAYQNDDGLGMGVSGLSFSGGVLNVGLDAATALGQNIPELARGIATHAMYPLIALEGGYQVYKEEDGSKLARLGAVGGTTAAALGTTAIVGTATAAAIAAPVVVAIGVGAIGNKAVEAYKVTEELDESIRSHEVSYRARDEVEASGAPKLSNYRNLNLFAVQEGTLPGGISAEGLSLQDKAKLVSNYEYSNDPKALADLKTQIQAKIDHYNGIIEENSSSWLNDSARIFGQDEVDTKRMAQIDRIQYVSALKELDEYKTELTGYKSNEILNVKDIVGGTTETSVVVTEQALPPVMVTDVNAGETATTEVQNNQAEGQEGAAEEHQSVAESSVAESLENNGGKGAANAKGGGGNSGERQGDASPKQPLSENFQRVVSNRGNLDCSVAQTPIFLFTQKDAVSKIQTFLIARNHEALTDESGAPIGAFGRITAKALNEELKIFQQSNNLLVTGRYDKNTRDALDAYVKNQDEGSAAAVNYKALRDGLNAMQDNFPDGQPNGQRANALDIVYNKMSLADPEQVSVCHGTSRALTSKP